MTSLIKFIGNKSLNSKQYPVLLSPRVIPSPPVFPRLYLPFSKKSKAMRFQLTVTGSPSFYKGDGGWGSVYFSKKGSRFFPQKRRCYEIMRE